MVAEEKDSEPHIHADFRNSTARCRGFGSKEKSGRCSDLKFRERMRIAINRLRFAIVLWFVLSVRGCAGSLPEFGGSAH